MEKLELGTRRRLASITFAGLLMFLFLPIQVEALVLPGPRGRSSTGIDPMGDNLAGPSYVDIRMAVISQKTDPSTAVELKISVNGALPGTPPADTCLVLAWLIDEPDVTLISGHPFNDIWPDFGFFLYGIGASNRCGFPLPFPVGVYSAWRITFLTGEQVPLPSFSIMERMVTVKIPFGLLPSGRTFSWVVMSGYFPSCVDLPLPHLCDLAPDTGHVTHRQSSWGGYDRDEPLLTTLWSGEAFCPCLFRADGHRQLSENKVEIPHGTSFSRKS